jgi:septal ring factor EnvC (AmiA/AmiB activator)
MIKSFFFLLLSFFIGYSSLAQSTAQQELEKQRLELKREIEQTQELLDKNKKNTKESLGQLSLINRKLNLQENIIDNISKDINLLDNSIYKSQRDINRLQVLLDTLKQEYAKSMLYAYKNRSSSDFLNFIFSASSFNDAIKRVTYLKSYRNYRELQGDNILRTKVLLNQNIEALTGNKIKKGQVLQTQSKELSVLETQQQEKNQIVKNLKQQGKELNNQISAKKKQMQKVSNAIAAAIKRAQEMARKEALAKALEEKTKRDAAERAAEKNKLAIEKGNAAVIVKPAPLKPEKALPISVRQESILLGNDAEVKLNANFISNKGTLPWPVDKGYMIMRFGPQKLDIGVTVDNPGITIGSEIGTSVKALFDGEVSSVTNIENMQVVIVKHGAYFTTYSNLSGVHLSRGQDIRTGQVVGKVAPNDEGIGSIDLIISNEKSNLNPEGWLRRR